MNRLQLKNYTHNQKEALTLKHPVYRREVFQHLYRELEKDLGEKGDITTDALLKNDDRIITAEIRAQETGILAGLQETEWLFKDVKVFNQILGEEKRDQQEPKNENKNRSTSAESIADLPAGIQSHLKDGDPLKPQDLILTIQEKARIVLKIERTILNLLQRLSGIATQTHHLVQQAKKIKPHILLAPTRKTHWGLLDKRAVTLGGGGTHRLNLSDAIIVKDNHLATQSDPIENVLTKILKKQESYRFIEIEVCDQKTALETAEAFKKLVDQEKLTLPAVIMLDNFTPANIIKTLDLLRSEKLYDYALLEASGGINQTNLDSYVKTSVDIISLGALTHSVKALDINLRLV